MSKTVKKVCKCEKCGNESEMIITCSLPDELKEEVEGVETKESEEQHKHHRVKGHAVCTHCGNEADMWVDLDE